ncbi:hypothetical protein ES705_38169 [subsurface metagenome]
MSEMLTDIRGLGRNFKQFFNTIAILPVRILTALRVVVSYEHSLHRIIIWKAPDHISAVSLGLQSIKKIPVGEIWIPEMIHIQHTSGTGELYDSIQIQRKGQAAACPYGPIKTPAQDLYFFRGIDYTENSWLYSGDRLYVNVSQESAGAACKPNIHYRKMRVGDDL